VSDGVGEVVGSEDRPGGGKYIHRQVGTYFLPVVEEGASQERQRERQREEAERRGRSRRAVRRTCKERERETGERGQSRGSSLSGIPSE